MKLGGLWGSFTGGFKGCTRGFVTGQRHSSSTETFDGVWDRSFDLRDTLNVVRVPSVLLFHSVD